MSGAAFRGMAGSSCRFEQMASILEIDTANGVAVVQPGVTRRCARQGDGTSRTRVSRLPWGDSASLGGNVADERGRDESVKYA